VAQHVGVSRSSLDADFRQELGCSVHDVIMSFKLKAAKAGLENGDCSFEDVALDSGLTSIQYMHRVFKRELGCSPRAYRDRVLSERGQMPPAQNLGC
jgi:LacI family transcriptional regulator